MAIRMALLTIGSPNGLDPNNANDSLDDTDRDGWTNLEEFLHFIAGDSSGG